MGIPESSYARIAYEAILLYVKTGEIRRKDEDKISPDLQLESACFVVIYDKKENVRSFYGSVKPTKKSLYEEILHAAQMAAKGVAGFKPLDDRELNEIRVEVLLVSELNSKDVLKTIKPGKEALLVEKDGQKGLFIPGVHRAKTPDDIFKKACKTGSLNGLNPEDCQLSSFRIAQYD